MKTLGPNLRRQLERAVVEARDTAEAGVSAALHALAVHEREPYPHMRSQDRALRRRLRAHGRQLGDQRNPRAGTQAIEHLAREFAYEHWHSMLFARFLAENDLLMEPDAGVPVTLKECEDLAKTRGIDKWMLAASFAHRMLPQVFRTDHPVVEIRLAPEHQLELQNLVESLPVEVFTATDSLGWVYQFWQSKKKNEVNRSEVKIGADELPAVTQLFTEPYMVNYLLDNSLGAWWAARHLSDTDLREADSEMDLRKKAAIPGVPLDNLRFVRADDAAEDGTWRLAADAFQNWPEKLADLKVLDPCCGSGHFLVAACSMLVPMRIQQEGLSAREAVDSVLRENVYGLELDARCVEIAAFALALAAWTYPEAGGYRPLPELNVACSGLAPNATKEEWIALAEQAAAAGGLPAERNLLSVEDSLLSTPLHVSLEGLYDLFKHAPERGSLINPRALKADLVQSNYQSAEGLFTSVLEREQTTDEQTERVMAAQGIARAAALLAGRYHLVITNVPYLARGKQNQSLRDYCQTSYPLAKNELATVFLERCLDFCVEGGTASLVLPQNWLFLKTYRRLREKLLTSETWRLLAKLGPRAFEAVSGEVVKAILLVISRGDRDGQSDRSLGKTTAPNTMRGVDVSEFRTAQGKADQIPSAEIRELEQSIQLKNPDNRILFGLNYKFDWFFEVADYSRGICTGDDLCFVRCFWEVAQVTRSTWDWQHSTSSKTNNFGGQHRILRWNNGKESLIDIVSERLGGHVGQWIRGKKVWGKKGILVSPTGNIKATLYLGDYFDANSLVVKPIDEKQLSILWAYCSSEQYAGDVREIDDALKVGDALVKVPFDLDYWTTIAEEKYPHGLPQPYSDDPTQWIFHGHPCGSVVWDETEKRTANGTFRSGPTVLQIAVARLLGYRWPAEQDAGMELAGEQREWVLRCGTLLDHADTDGIVCIPSVRGEDSAVDRLSGMLAECYGDAWSAETLSRLLTGTDSASLDDWLRTRFFEEHCKLFHNRPFIWHVWDGRAGDGFHAFVNYHKLADSEDRGRQCLESLTYSYLGDWISRQRDGVARGAEGAEGRLTAALELQKRLELILAGEPPFDIFVRWKPLGEQPIGWNPDPNDGVRLNIRPFMASDIPGGRKGAGILRIKPNIKWAKDRGKEPFRDQQCFPWFWRNGEFTSSRINDVHLTISEKSRQKVG